MTSLALGHSNDYHMIALMTMKQPLIKKWVNKLCASKEKCWHNHNKPVQKNNISILYGKYPTNDALP